MIIVHRCNNCGHNSLERRNFGRGNTCGIILYNQRCECLNTVDGCDWGLPEVIPTYTPDGQLIEEVFPPGEEWMPTITACDCEHCQLAYTMLTG